MAASATSAGELMQDINVLPLIDVLLVLLIMVLVMLRGLIFIPAQIPPPAAAGAVHQPGDQIVLELLPDGSFALNTHLVPPGQLDTQLHAIFDGRPVKLIFIKAADSRSYQEVVSAMDLARGAGVQVLGFVPRASVTGEP
jgi:biopolymer transport protein ExbD